MLTRLMIYHHINMLTVDGRMHTQGTLKCRKTIFSSFMRAILAIFFVWPESSNCLTPTFHDNIS